MAKRKWMQYRLICGDCGHEDKLVIWGYASRREIFACPKCKGWAVALGGKALTPAEMQAIEEGTKAG